MGSLPADGAASAGAPPRVAFLASHPIQYQVPLFRAITESGRVDLDVLFLSDFGVKPTFDPGFDREVRYDVPLTEGFAHQFVPRLRRASGIGPPFGLVNPSLVRVLRRGRYDAVVVQGYVQVSDWIAFASVLTTGARLLLRGETPAPPPGADIAVRWRAKRLLLTPIVRRTSACLAIGERNAEFWQRLGARPDQIVLAPYSVDNARFAAGGREGRATRTERLRQLELDDDRPIVLFAAKLIPRKRVFDLIAAMDRLDGAASLVVIGDGEQREEVAASAAERPWMRVLGFVNQAEIPLWYGTADIVVLPSDHETWGLTINEAMAAGAVPVVSDAVGCGPDLVEGGVGGTFPVGDVAALTSELERLLDPATLDRHRREARLRIARYGLDATVAGIESAVLRSR